MAGCGLLDSGSKRCWHSHPAPTKQHDRQSPASCASHAPKWTRSLHSPLPGGPSPTGTRGQCGAAAGRIMAWARGGALAPAFARGRPAARAAPARPEGPARLATTVAPTKGQALSGSVLRLMARSTPLVRFAGSKSQPAASEKAKGPLVGRVPLCHAAPYPCPWCQAASAENPFSCGEKPSPVLII